MGQITSQSGDWLFTDMRIREGASGAPLVNDEGEVMGLMKGEHNITGNAIALSVVGQKVPGVE